MGDLNETDATKKANQRKADAEKNQGAGEHKNPVPTQNSDTDRGDKNV